MDQKLNLTAMLMAANMQGITLPESIAYQLELTRKKVIEKGLDFTLQDAIMIQEEVKRIYPEQKNEG